MGGCMVYCEPLAHSCNRHQQQVPAVNVRLMHPNLFWVNGHKRVFWVVGQCHVPFTDHKFMGRN